MIKFIDTNILREIEIEESTVRNLVENMAIAFYRYENVHFESTKQIDVLDASREKYPELIIMINDYVNRMSESRRMFQQFEIIRDIDTSKVRINKDLFDALVLLRARSGTWSKKQCESIKNALEFFHLIGESTRSSLILLEFLQNAEQVVLRKV